MRLCNNVKVMTFMSKVDLFVYGCSVLVLSGRHAFIASPLELLRVKRKVEHHFDIFPSCVESFCANVGQMSNNVTVGGQASSLKH